MVHPEGMSDFVKNRLADLLAKLVYVAKIPPKRVAVDDYPVGKNHAVSAVSLSQRDSNVQAVKLRPRRNVHLDEVVGVRGVFDDDCDVFEAFEQPVGNRVECLVDEPLEFNT